MLERASLAAAGRRRGLGNTVEGQPKSGRIIAVMSPKGGVGKTTDHHQPRRGVGQRKPPWASWWLTWTSSSATLRPGCMLDPEKTLADAVVGAAVQDSVVLKSYLTLHPSGIYALCAPLNPTEADQISGEQVGRLLEPAVQRIPVRRGGYGTRARRTRSGDSGTGHGRGVGLRHGHTQHPGTSYRIRRPRPNSTLCQRTATSCSISRIGGPG